MSTALFLRRTALLVGLVLTVSATGQAQTTPPTAAPPLDAAAFSHQMVAAVGARPIAPPIAPTPAEVSAAERGKLTHTLAALPLSFEPNRGQSPSDVRFLTRAPGYLVQLTATEMRLIVQGASAPSGRARMAQPPEHATAETAETPKARTHAVKLTWLDANRHAAVAPEAPLPGTVNYFKGSDASTWHTNIPTFERVCYKELYPGIDLVYYGNGRQLEYDLIVAPGADPTPARLTLEGAAVSLTGNGALDLTLSDGRRFQLRALVAYQERDGARVMVEAHYRLSRHGDTSEIAFQLAAYDPERPLIIDPLVYSTFLGGSDSARGQGIAVNAAGEAFVTGHTYDAAIEFPTTPGAFDTTYNGGDQDAFVAKLNAAGSALVYSTFLGGGAAERGLGIAVTAVGEAFVTGFTVSANFPTTPGAFATTHNGGYNDAFVAKLNAAGSMLVYSTFLGGSGSDIGQGIAVNAAGEAFVTGATDSDDFPTTPGAFDTTHNGSYSSDAFVAKLNAAGSALVYSTFLGGSGTDTGNGIAVTAAGEAFVTGATGSANFPTTAGAFTTVHQGNGDAFVAKLNATGSALVYSTFLGGVSYDGGNGIAVTAAGEAFVTGTTSSGNFPTTAGAFNTIYNGGNSDAFVAKFNAAGVLVYSTFLGGSGLDAASGIAVTAAGEAFVTGATTSADFPTTAGAFNTTYNGGLYDAFVAQLDVAGKPLVYSTFLGGSGRDDAYGIAVNAAGEAVVTGETGSANFPTTAGAFNTTYNGGPSDAFVAKIAATGPFCVAPPSGMVAWYPLDELAGATAINDIAPPPSSTVQNVGTPQPGPVGPPGPAPVAGYVGGALYFDGTSVEVAPHAELDFSTGDFPRDTGVTAFSIDAWVRIAPVQPISIKPIVDKFSAPSGPGFAFYISNQRLALTMNGSTFVGPLIDYANPLANTGPWYHVAVTVHGGGRVPGEGVFYIDGVQAGTFTPSADSVNNGLPLWIGATRMPGAGRGIAIDELELFNRALPQSDIQAIFNAGSAGKCKPCPACLRVVDRDFNGDGKADILWRNATSGLVYAWLLDGTSVIGQGALGAPTTDWQIVGVGDFNGDGTADLLWRHTSGLVYAWLLDGTSVIGQGALGAPTTDWQIVGVGDFNGDGTADLLWRHTSGLVYAWLLDGTSVIGQGALGAPTTDWQIVGVGDFNGDGTADLLWRHTSGLVYAWLLNGTTVIGQGSPGSVGIDWTVVGVGDFNGDGTADILWRHTSGLVYAWLLDGTSVIGQGALGAPTTDWQIVGVGDFNGDGKADILWRHTSGAVYIWSLDGTSIIGQGAPGGASTDWQIQ